MGWALFWILYARGQALQNHYGVSYPVRSIAESRKTRTSLFPSGTTVSFPEVLSRSTDWVECISGGAFTYPIYRVFRKRKGKGREGKERKGNGRERKGKEGNGGEGRKEKEGKGNIASIQNAVQRG